MGCVEEDGAGCGGGCFGGRAAAAAAAAPEGSEEAAPPLVNEIGGGGSEVVAPPPPPLLLLPLKLGRVCPEGRDAADAAAAAAVVGAAAIRTPSTVAPLEEERVAEAKDGRPAATARLCGAGPASVPLVTSGEGFSSSDVSAVCGTVAPTVEHDAPALGADGAESCRGAAATAAGSAWRPGPPAAPTPGPSLLPRGPEEGEGRPRAAERDVADDVACRPLLLDECECGGWAASLGRGSRSRAAASVCAAGAGPTARVSGSRHPELGLLVWLPCPSSASSASTSYGACVSSSLGKGQVVGTLDGPVATLDVSDILSFPQPASLPLRVCVCIKEWDVLYKAFFSFAASRTATEGRWKSRTPQSTTVRQQQTKEGALATA